MIPPPKKKSSTSVALNCWLMGDGLLLSASRVMGLSLVNLSRSQPGRAAALVHLAARDIWLFETWILSWTRVAWRLSMLTVRGQTLDHFDGCVEPKLGQAPVVFFLSRNTLHLHRVPLRCSMQTQTRQGRDMDGETCIKLFFPKQTISSLLTLDRDTLTRSSESWCRDTGVNTSSRKSAVYRGHV